MNIDLAEPLVYQLEDVLNNAEYSTYQRVPVIIVFSERNQYDNPDRHILLTEKTEIIEETYDNQIFSQRQTVVIEGKETSRELIKALLNDVLTAIREAKIPYKIRSLIRIPDLDRYTFRLTLEGDP